MMKQREELFLHTTSLPIVVIHLIQEYLDQVTKIAAGYSHSLILLESGQVLATGDNGTGQLGIGNDVEQTTPVLMNLGKDKEGKQQKATAMAAGGFHSLILLESGQVLATGSNIYGQLGTENRDDQTTPVPMNLGKSTGGGEQKATAIAAGIYHSLILLESGQVLATGYNGNGRLGIGNDDNQMTPVPMNLGKDKEGKEQKATAMAAGGCHSLILLESGQVLATGHNGHGQLGIGNRDDQTTLVLMNLGENKEEKEQKATAIDAGESHSLIMLESGQVLATGRNSYGQLGNGNDDFPLDNENDGIPATPVLMNLGKDKEGKEQMATAMAVGDHHSLILLESGQVLATGSNSHGQLGIWNRDDQTTPVLMSLGKNTEGEEQKVMTMAAGGHHSLILLENGQVLSTGSNNYGQLGIGNNNTAMAPVPMGQHEENEKTRGQLN